MDRKLKKAVPVAVVQHANQYLITNGYTNRPGITEILGTPGDRGLRAVVKLHAAYQVPLNLHLSGTLIEAIAWHDPKFLEEIRALVSDGLIEIVGSTYAQNIMPLFSAAHNRWQIIEALKLYTRWFGIAPSEVKVFWPPERVWNTSRLAPVLADSTLPNGGYDAVLLDDRILLPPAKRRWFDATMETVPALFQARPIVRGRGLIVLPLSRMARLSVPFETPVHRQNFASLIASASDFSKGSIIIYGDDMEKCSAIAPWNPAGVRWYEAFLRFLTRQDEVEVVLLTPWLRSQQSLGEAWPVAPGTYKELACDFGAGESYSAWAEGNKWKPYARILKRVDEVIQGSEDSCSASDALLELAKKQYAACTFETAWHDAPGSIHGSAATARPTPWAKALAKHAAAAMVIVKARQWARARASENEASVHVIDLDEDGHEEVVLRNEYLAAVISPRFGGRLVYLFAFRRGDGALLVGNPADAWNWMEELNDYPELPPNHPGALADLGFEHDRYGVHIDRAVSRGRKFRLI